MASLLSNIRYGVGVGLENLGGLFGVPETGLSEKIAGRNTPKTVGVTNAQAPNVLSRQPVVQAPKQGPSGDFRSQGLLDYQTQVLGPVAQKSTGGSSGGGGGNNSYTNDEYRDPFTGATYASRAAYDAELGAANSAFDYQRDQLNNQLSSLGGQRDNALAELETGLSGVKSQIDTSRQNAQTNTTKQIQEAGATAKSTQQQNRNVLRALGIINSTAAGELLSKPVNEFDKQRVNLNQALGQRMNELDSFLDQKVAEANNAKNNILSQFTDLYNNIQSDLRFNERQRVDAVRQATAALQQRLSDIQSSLLNYRTQVDLQRQNIGQGMQQINSYANPQYNAQGFNKLSLTTPDAQREQIGITQPTLTAEQIRKNLLNGGLTLG